MSIANGLSILIVIILLIKLRKEKENPLKELSNKKASILAVSLIIIFAFLLTFKLGSIPYGLHVDEAGMAYDALNLANHGVDRYLYHNPVYFINFGGGQNALYTYLTSILLKVFDYSITVIRMPAVLLSILSASVFYLLIKKEKSKVEALITLFLLCILPFSIMHSRWALESYLFFPMLILSSYFLINAWKKEKRSYFILSGIFFGLTLYTYAISYLIIPIFLGILLIYGLTKKEIKLSNILWMGVPLFLMALPLILMLLVNNGYLNEINSFISIPKLWQYRGGEFSLRNIPKNLGLFFTIFGGDWLPYNTFPKFGTLYYISIPLIIYGIYKSIKKITKEKKFSIDFYFIVLFLVITACLLIVDGPNVNRANAIYVSLIYFLGVGVTSLYQKKNWTIYLLLSVYLIFFGLFTEEYFIEYPQKVRDTYFFVSTNDLKEALEFTSSSREKIYVIDDWIHEAYIYTLLETNTNAFEFQETMQKEEGKITSFKNYYFTLEEINEKNIYIFLKENQIPEEIKERNFEVKSFGNIKVYYKKELLS